MFAHPLLMLQVERLEAAVGDAQSVANAKLLAALRRLMFEIIPTDPTRAEYRQGDTLGSGRRHWFRAKLGSGRFRLFFRFDTRSKIIIYVWVNDRSTLRAYGSRTDAYLAFRSMLERGEPPDDWETLLATASAPSVT